MSNEKTVAIPGDEDREKKIPRTDIAGDLSHEEKIVLFHKTRIEELGSAPLSYQGVLSRAYAGNRPSAVKAFCLQCCGYQRVEISDCRVYRCALWVIRPYQQKPGEPIANNEEGTGEEESSEE